MGGMNIKLSTGKKDKILDINSLSLYDFNSRDILIVRTYQFDC